jgi:tartrate-resistant acid phosphatase type 5
MHGNSTSSLQTLVPLYRRAGVRLVLSGHEHNFQHSRADAIDYFVTGGGGKVRTATPHGFEAAHTVSWAPSCHFLLVKVRDEAAEVTPIGGDGRPLELRSPSGAAVPATAVVRLT